jgi:hypothetical protein
MEGIMKWAIVAFSSVVLSAMLAAATPASALNPTHYQCYPVKADRFKPLEVRVQDQFGLQTVKVIAPTKLCAPASKNNSEVTDKRTHYLCYKIDGGLVANRKARIRNQFGTIDVLVTQADELCLPSLKRLQPQ